jgi:hypothetical protein
MSSQNPVIAVRMPPELYARIQAAAHSEGRSLSNFVVHRLRQALPLPSGAFPPGHPRREAGSQVDLEELTGAIARTVEQGPGARTARQPRGGK